MRNPITLALLGALSATTSTNASPMGGRLARRNVLTPLPSSADAIEYKYQPVMDFDTDGCYNTAAIDPTGKTNDGLGSVAKGPADECHVKDRLLNNNVYSRKRCNNGWCAIMYEYYFEKDQAIWGSFLGGHRHDWENVVVFVQGDVVKWVSPSCHGGYPSGTATPRFFEDGTSTRAKVVYHKDGASTHCIRQANPSDDNIENALGAWFSGPLIGWDHWPSTSLRDKMLSTWSGGVGPKLDSEFAGELAEAAGNHVPGFDPNVDA